VLAWGSGGESGLAGEVVEGGLVGAVGGAKGGRRGRAGVGDLGDAGAQRPVVDAGEELGRADAGVGDLVAEGSGDPLDQPEGGRVARPPPDAPGPRRVSRPDAPASPGGVDLARYIDRRRSPVDRCSSWERRATTSQLKLGDLIVVKRRINFEFVRIPVARLGQYNLVSLKQGGCSFCGYSEAQ